MTQARLFARFRPFMANYILYFKLFTSLKCVRDTKSIKVNIMSAYGFISYIIVAL